MKKSLFAGMTSLVLAGSLLSGVSSPSFAKQVDDHSLVRHDQHYHGTVDLAIINDERLIESLVKRGLIAEDATQEEKQRGLRAYLDLKGKQTETKSVEDDPIAPKVKAAAGDKEKKFKEFNNGLLNGIGNKKGHLKGNPAPVKETPYNGEPRQDNVLVIAVEFSDFPHNSIQPGETDMYYPDYNLEHYDNMIFSNSGWSGPNGENFVSMKQYYEQQSGGTYTVGGETFGWLKVPGTAAFYGADLETGGHDNVTPGGSKKLVIDTYKAALEAGIPLENYDQEDPHDLDGDGNLREPDGLVDHLMIIHSSIGQEAGGGSLGDDAIWSHRSVKYVDFDGFQQGKPGFYDYTMMPEDGAVGVFAHEYGHDLGLPDEYDTIYSGAGEPVSYWSIMSSGSWAGKVPGTEPTGFSPWAKQYFQATMGGNWTNSTVVEWNQVSEKGIQFLLDQANSPNGQNNQAVKVKLPKKENVVNQPTSGQYEYFSGNGNNLDHSMISTLDLSNASSASLSFNTWYKIEEDWDYASVQVKASDTNENEWQAVEGNITTTEDPYGYGQNPGHGITGDSNGWVKANFDLSAYAGQVIELKFNYWTDGYVAEQGFYADDIVVTVNGNEVLEDDAEGDSSFVLDGFTKDVGKFYSDHYYLLEWRNHAGVDKGLAHIKRGKTLMTFDGGLVVWYVDDSLDNNWTGAHPGDGFLGVVDAHTQEELMWSHGIAASTRYHVRDAAFGLNPTSELFLDYGYMQLQAQSQENVSLFNDSNLFTNTFLPDAGRNVPMYGLKVRVNGQSSDKSVGSIVIYK